MRNLILTAAAFALLIFTNCDPKAEHVQEEDTTSEKVLKDGETPSQYQGSTGVEDENNNMVANENIGLKKQDFKGSFSTTKTQTYNFTVLETDDYTFSIESSNPDVQYIVSQKDGPVIIEASNQMQKAELRPGEYVITGTVKTDTANPVKPETEFTVHIE